eukprot:jgi/Psemu1/313182/fgenesh1_kg.1117_\
MLQPIYPPGGACRNNDVKLHRSLRHYGIGTMFHLIPIFLQSVQNLRSFPLPLRLLVLLSHLSVHSNDTNFLFSTLTRFPIKPTIRKSDLHVASILRSLLGSALNPIKSAVTTSPSLLAFISTIYLPSIVRLTVHSSSYDKKLLPLQIRGCLPVA